MFDDEIFAKPKILKPKCVKYKNAQKFAKEIDLDCMTYALVTGSFVFGDFIEALVEAKDLKCSEIWLSTLGMGQNNIDSIGNFGFRRMARTNNNRRANKPKANTSKQGRNEQCIS